MSDPLDNFKPNVSLDDPDPAPPPGGGERTRKPRSDKGVKRGPRGSSRKFSSKISDADLVKSVEELLVLPSVPAAIAYPSLEGKMYMINHFTATAPWGAKKLVEASKHSPALRAQLEKLNEKAMLGFLITFAAVYLGGPALYFIGKHDAAQFVTGISQIDESALKMMMENVVSQMVMDAMQNGAQNTAGTSSETDESAEPTSD